MVVRLIEDIYLEGIFPFESSKKEISAKLSTDFSLTMDSGFLMDSMEVKTYQAVKTNYPREHNSIRSIKEYMDAFDSFVEFLNSRVNGEDY